MTMTSTTIPTKLPEPFAPATGTRSERACDVVLTDGSRVVVRVYESRDRDALVTALDALSPESRRARFLSAATKLAPGLVRHLVEVDLHAHVVLVAEHAGRIVGDARYVRARTEPGVAEMAFFVADDLHRRGLGRAMVLTATAEVARPAGPCPTALHAQLVAQRSDRSVAASPARGRREAYLALRRAGHRARPART